MNNLEKDLYAMETDIDKMWKSVSVKYISTLKKAKDLMVKEEFNEDNVGAILDRMKKFIDNCKNQEFQVAFIGTIKAGKSTLINAMLGKNLASVSVTPETATLTKFKACNDKNYIKIKFYNNNEWNQLIKSAVSNGRESIFIKEYNKSGAKEEINKWLNHEEIKLEYDDVDTLAEELEKWTSSKQKAHYYVKEAEVGLVNSNIPNGIILVDTPGLDDPVEFRSNVTREYIDSANAVLVCVKADSLTGQELNVIYRVFANSNHNLSKILIVGTKVDTFNQPELDWMKQKEEWIKILVDSYGSFELAKNNIIGVSAHAYNIVNDDVDNFEIEVMKLKYRLSNENYTDDEIKKAIINASNIERLKDIIDRNIISKYKKILLDDMKENYNNINKDILIKFSNIKEKEKDIINSKNDDRNEINKKIKIYEDEYKKAEEDFEECMNELKSIKKYMDNKVRMTFDKIISIME